MKNDEKIKSIIEELKVLKGEYQKELELLPKLDKKIQDISKQIETIQNADYPEKLKKVIDEIKNELGADVEITDELIINKTAEYEKQITDTRREISKIENEIADSEKKYNELLKEKEELENRLKEAKINGVDFFTLLKDKEVKTMLDKFSKDDASFVIVKNYVDMRSDILEDEKLWKDLNLNKLEFLEILEKRIEE